MTHVSRRARYLPLASILLGATIAYGQTEPQTLAPLLKEEILAPAVAESQIRRYIIDRTAPPPDVSATPQAWTTEASRLRKRLLDVTFHGWPREWIDAPPRFDEAAVIETGHGYRIRKLRYEIVPGLQSQALLYEPDRPSGKIPAILYVHGHVGKPGMTIEYGQKFCINFAKHGTLVLSLEWFSFGELDATGNEHWFGAHLDLVGLNELGAFYLAMRRGLDYLAAHPNVDRNRIGMTGLSGGGWQTIVLSALDERVRVSNPVAGFSSLRTRVEARHYGDLGDVEQSATDFLDEADYTHLAAMMAPRPTLLTYNAEDECCFRAGLVRPLIHDRIQPFFKLFGKDSHFAWYENRDPADHNYQLDNRLAAFRFFSEHFGLPAIDRENQIAPEVRSYDELVVSLPQDNLTLLGLAQKLGREIVRDPIPSEPAAHATWSSAERARLENVVRYQPVEVSSSWAVAATKAKDLQSTSFLLSMNNGLSATGVWMRSILQSSDAAPVTIVLDDEGKESGADVASDRVNRGDQVLALDLMFTGAAWRGQNKPYLFAQMLHGLGDRTIGMEAGQLVTVARWARARSGAARVRLEARGVRSQLQALVAAALEPDLFSELVVRKGMRSLRYALDLPVPFQDAPDLFCLDLYKYFDIDRLESIAKPVKVTVVDHVETLVN